MMLRVSEIQEIIGKLPDPNNYPDAEFHVYHEHDPDGFRALPADVCNACLLIIVFKKVCCRDGLYEWVADLGSAKGNQGGI